MLADLEVTLTQPCMPARLVLKRLGLQSATASHNYLASAFSSYNSALPHSKLARAFNVTDCGARALM
jgi:hypothetical protein